MYIKKNKTKQNKNKHKKIKPEKELKRYLQLYLITLLMLKIINEISLIVQIFKSSMTNVSAH